MCRRSQHIINHIRHILCIVLKHAHTKNFHHFKICLFPSRQIFPPSTYLDHLEILQCLVPMKTDGIGGYQLVETWKIRRLPWGKATNGPKKKRHSKSMMSWERKVLNVHSNLSFLEIKYKQELLVLLKNTVFYMKLQLVVGTFASRLLDVSRVILLSLLWQKNLSSWHGWPTDSQVITQQTTPLPDSTPQKKTNPQNLRILTPILEV